MVRLISWSIRESRMTPPHAFEFVAQQFAFHQVFNDVFLGQGKLLVEFRPLLGILAASWAPMGISRTLTSLAVMDVR